MGQFTNGSDGSWVRECDLLSSLVIIRSLCHRQDGVLREVQRWRVVTLWEQNRISWFKKLSILSLSY